MFDSYPALKLIRSLISFRTVGLWLFALGVVAPLQVAPRVLASPQAFVISGRVTDGFGNGIGSATVSLSGAQAGSTLTDTNGNYAFPNLPAGGSYNLSPSKAGQYTGFARVVNNLSSDQVVDLRLDPFIRVDVRVADASGIGLAGVAIGINGATFGLPQTNSFGNVNFTLGVTEAGNTQIALTPIKPGYTFDPATASLSSQNGNQSLFFRAAVSSVPPSFVQFSAPSYFVGEGDGSATITVTRSGDVSSMASVFYFSGDAGVATQTRDYTMAGGMIHFAPGETSKTFSVLITDNVYVQGTHTLFLQLGSPTGGAFLGTPYFVTLSIEDNDSLAPTTNPTDGARSFVRQHYADFLNRVPDQGGLDYWAEQITRCGTDAACLQERRIAVSAAFFVEQEFQQTGYVIYRLNRAALGMIPSYTHFMVERSRLMGGDQLHDSTLAYARDFVQGGAFAQFYPESMSPTDFVNRLFATAGLTDDVLRQQEIQALNDGIKSRADVLLDVIEVPAFKTREYNQAFVLMQYYGYLRRDPDPGGYQFWLNILNNALPNDASGHRAMVCAFITSDEYQDRFSPVRTHTNSECGP